MTITHFDDARDISLDTDQLVQQRVEDLVGRAIRRQIWLLLLDQQLRQLPVLLPIDDVPDTPEAATDENLQRLIATIATEFDVGGVVVVIERPGASQLTSADRMWLRTFHSATGAAGLVRVRFVLSHDAGVRVLSTDDWI